MQEVAIITLFYLMFYLNVALVHADNISERPELRDRLIMDNTIPTTDKVTNIIDCYRSCKKADTCYSISYNMAQSACLLYSSLNLGKNGTVQDGWMYFSEDITDFCPLSSGYVRKTHVNMCFKLFQITKNNADAAEVCESDGAALIRIDSTEKQNTVVSYLLSEHTGLSQIIYIQGQRVWNSNKWAFDDGTDVTYLPWNVYFHVLQPDGDKSSGQTGLGMNTEQDGLWHDLTPSIARMFICEKRIP